MTCKRFLVQVTTRPKVEISADGTMASTYGKYRWMITDAAGKETSYHGIFHTVWKKQSDGTWKYVWD